MENKTERNASVSPGLVPAGGAAEECHAAIAAPLPTDDPPRDDAWLTPLGGGPALDRSGWESV